MLLRTGTAGSKYFMTIKSDQSVFIKQNVRKIKERFKFIKEVTLLNVNKLIQSTYFVFRIALNFYKHPNTGFN